MFSSGARLAMFGLNLTEETYVMPADLERVKTWPTNAGAFLNNVLTHSVDSHAGWGYPGASMHDPCPVVYLIRPGLFTMQEMHVGVEVQAGENFGRTTGDPLGRYRQAANARVAVRADQRAVIEFMIDRLERLP